MTYQEIAKLVDSFGLPYNYYQFNAPQDPPFVCFYYQRSVNFPADNMNYSKGATLIIELYTARKDVKLEKKIEKILDEAEMVYSKYEEYINSEKMFQILFEMEVNINES